MSDCQKLAKKPRFDFTAENLPDHPLFVGLSVTFRQILAESAMKADFAAGEKVVEAGEPANGFFMIIQGSIDLETAESRRPTRVQTITAGDILGWSWLFPPYYWHFNAVAREPVRTIFFFGSKLHRQCDLNHDFGYALIKGMSQFLIGHLQTDRERWIEAAHTAPSSSGVLTDYLVI
jgi:CRP/FNR family transcriptional regulator, cyclic AMP receptor protein